MSKIKDIVTSGKFYFIMQVLVLLVFALQFYTLNIEYRSKDLMALRWFLQEESNQMFNSAILYEIYTQYDCTSDIIQQYIAKRPDLEFEYLKEDAEPVSQEHIMLYAGNASDWVFKWMLSCNQADQALVSKNMEDLDSAYKGYIAYTTSLYTGPQWFIYKHGKKILNGTGIFILAEFIYSLSYMGVLFGKAGVFSNGDSE